MALPNSGSLSFSQIKAEFNKGDIFLSYLGCAPGVPTNAPLSFSDFYGKSNSFVFNKTISGDVANYNLKQDAINNGWNQVTPLSATITINSGIVVYANSTSAYAFDTGNGFPAGSVLSLVNNGFVIGMGGDGGAYNSSGSPGGPALRAQAALRITNGGTIGGGGGGGGGTTSGWSGGGGGRTGRVNSGGGQGYQDAGGIGTFNSAGQGGNYAGGDGGDWGSYGNTGDGGNGGWGGAGGEAVVGNSNITWLATGTRMGSIT